MSCQEGSFKIGKTTTTTTVETVADGDNLEEDGEPELLSEITTTYGVKGRHGKNIVGVKAAAGNGAKICVCSSVHNKAGGIININQ
jgi:hypothetical protein